MERITQFSVVTERGSEYNIEERENFRKMTASEQGGGYYNITEPLGGGEKKRESGKFYLTQPKTSHPPFLGDKDRTSY